MLLAQHFDLKTLTQLGALYPLLFCRVISYVTNERLGKLLRIFDVNCMKLFQEGLYEKEISFNFFKVWNWILYEDNFRNAIWCYIKKTKFVLNLRKFWSRIHEKVTVLIYLLHFCGVYFFSTWFYILPV